MYCHQKLRKKKKKKEKQTNKETAEKLSPAPHTSREVYSVTVQYNPSYSSPKTISTSRSEGFSTYSKIKCIDCWIHPMLIKIF